MIVAQLALAALLSTVVAAPQGTGTTDGTSTTDCTVTKTVQSTITSTTTTTLGGTGTETGDPNSTATATATESGTATTTTTGDSTTTTDAGNSITTTDADSTGTTATSQVNATMTETSGTAAATETGNGTSTATADGAKYTELQKFAYGKDKIRGVNLGGWLLLESWITPSLFDKTGDDKIVDEYTFTSLQDKATAEAALKEHWESFVTEDDFKEIAAAGLNHVRIPIGDWAYDLQPNETYIGGQDAYLEKSIGWAKTHGIKVMIDLHGVPGSQNGFDNSGQVGETRWHTNPEYMKRSVDVIANISTKYAAPEFADTVTSIGLLNEPAGFRDPKVTEAAKQFFLDAYPKVRFPFPDRPDEQSGTYVVIADAFVDMKQFADFMPEDKFPGVGIDTHYYQIFTDGQNTWNQTQRIEAACGFSAKLESAPLPPLTGEWSLAASDCAKYLNGRGKGARYDGTYEGPSINLGNCSSMTGSGDEFSTDYKDFLQKFWDVQTQVNEKYGTGWLFWTWKNEEAAEWSYKRGMELGFISEKADEHKYKLEDVCK